MTASTSSTELMIDVTQSDDVMDNVTQSDDITDDVHARGMITARDVVVEDV